MEMEIVNGKNPIERVPVQKIKFCVVDEGITELCPGHEPIIALGKKHSLEIDGVQSTIPQSFLVYARTIEEATRVSIIVSEITEE